MKRALIWLVTLALGTALATAETKKCTLNEMISEAVKAKKEIFTEEVLNAHGDQKLFSVAYESFNDEKGAEISGDILYVTEFDADTCRHRTISISKSLFANYNFVWGLVDQERLCLAVLDITRKTAKGNITILDNKNGMLKFMNGDLLEFTSYNRSKEKKIIPYFSAKFENQDIDELIKKIEILKQIYEDNEGASFYIGPDLNPIMEIDTQGKSFYQIRKAYIGINPMLL